MENNKILIVEDEEIIRLGLKDNFELENYIVETAGDGEEAIEKADTFLPDLVILDLMIPKKSGFEVCRYIRKKHPDTLYQYRPDWLGRQSLDLYIPSLRTAIEYQGVQHYRPIAFFGGEEAHVQRLELDLVKRQLCEENQVRLIEWPYDVEPTDKNIKRALHNSAPEGMTSFEVV